MIDLERMLAEAQAVAKSHGLSVRALCERANVAQSNWARWKARRSSPTFATWTKIQHQLRLLSARGRPTPSEQSSSAPDSRAGHAGALNSHPIPETELSPQFDGLPAPSEELDSRGASPSLVLSSSNRERRECAEGES